MATKINAVDVVVKVNNKVLGCAQSASFNVTREMDEATCSDSEGWAEFSPGQKAWSGSIGALLRDFTAQEVAANVSFDDIFDMLDEGDLVTVEFARKNGTKRYSGDAYVEELGNEQPTKGAVTWSATFRGNGKFGPITA